MSPEINVPKDDDITPEERQRRVDAAMANSARLRADPTVPRKHFWLSFADDSGFLGGCVVDDVVDFPDAIRKTKELGINPGGEVLAMEIPDIRMMPAGYHPINRLMTKAEVEKLEND